MISRQRNPFIDQMRGISILLVVLHHFDIAYKLAKMFGDDSIMAGISRAIVRNGNYGVTIFFVISGFLITTNAMARWGALGQVSLRDFYILRAGRIIPPLLLLLAIVAAIGALSVPLFQSKIPGTTELVSPLIVYGAGLSFSMNVLIERLGWVNYPLGVLWSLSVEGVFYLTFPLICLLLKTPGRIATFLIAIVIVGPFYRAVNQGESGAYLYAYFSAFDGIAIGCLAALALARFPRLGEIPAWARWLTALSMAAFYLSGPIKSNNIWGVTMMALGAAILLLAAVSPPKSEPARAGSGRVLSAALETLGRCSYELYLFHLVVLGLMRTAVPPKGVVGGAIVPMLLLIFLLLSVACAAIIKRWYGDPLDRLLRRRLMRKLPDDRELDQNASRPR